MSYRQLEPHEEKLEENVLAMWDTFLVSVQDAMDFVNVQTPLITQNLEDIYQVNCPTQSAIHLIIQG